MRNKQTDKQKRKKKKEKRKKKEHIKKTHKNQTDAEKQITVNEIFILQDKKNNNNTSLHQLKCLNNKIYLCTNSAKHARTCYKTETHNTSE